MVPFLGMLERHGLSVLDAESYGRDELALAVRRCQRCVEKAVCVHWLGWGGRDGRAPQCTNACYFARVKVHVRRSAVRARI